MYEPAQPVWRQATDFLVPLYALTNKFPKDELAARMNQLRAAAVGLTVNLAESLSCESEPDLQKFLDSSYKSARDCVEELRIADRLNLCPRCEVETLIAQAEEIVQALNNLLSNLKPAL